MNIVDSSGWVEYLVNGANAGYFAEAIQASEKLLTPTICMYEVFKRVYLEFGEDRALDAIGILSLGQIVDMDRQIAIESARISLELKLAMAESIILATARAHSAELWTQDVHFAGLDGVKYIEKSL